MYSATGKAHRSTASLQRMHARDHVPQTCEQTYMAGRVTRFHVFESFQLGVS